MEVGRMWTDIISVTTPGPISGGDGRCSKWSFRERKSVYKISSIGSSLTAQWVKDLMLSLLWLRQLLWHKFNPWPGNFHMLHVWPQKNKQTVLTLAVHILKLEEYRED